MRVLSTVNFAVVGVKNFAASHIRSVRQLEASETGRLAALVALPENDGDPLLDELKQAGVTIYRSYEDLLRDGQDSVDVITLPIAIQHHADMAIRAMEAGFNVVLEKPPAPTVDEVYAMMRAEAATGRFCALGFQHLYSSSIRKLKRLICDGELGAVSDLAAKGYWPRFDDYYTRNPWAGRTLVQGRLVLDGPMHNALGHYLNVMLYLASPQDGVSAAPETVRAELYRGHSYIQADDTSCLEVVVDSGASIRFYVTHACTESADPYMEIRGTKGMVRWYMDERTEVSLADGRQLHFDSEGIEPRDEVMRVAAAVHQDRLASPFATLATSLPFVQCINGAYLSAREIRPIPSELVREYEEAGVRKTAVDGVPEVLDEAFARRQLLSDIGVPWAKASRAVDVRGLREFNPFAPLSQDEASPKRGDRA